MKKINPKPLDIEETLLDDLLKKRKDNSEILERKIETPLKRKVFFVFAILGIFFLLFLLGLTFKLQVLDYENYKNLSEKNKFMNLRIESARGIVYDRNMQQLVSNEVKFEPWVNEFGISAEEKEEILEKVAKIVNLDIETFLKDNNADKELFKELEFLDEYILELECEKELTITLAENERTNKNN